MVICQDPVVKGITTIMNRSNPEVKLLLGYGKLLLSIIISFLLSFGPASKVPTLTHYGMV